jgi:hypothetical protein
VKDIERMSELFAETLEMESVYNKVTQQYEPVDPVISENITVEFQKVGERIADFIKKVNSKK